MNFSKKILISTVLGFFSPQFSNATTKVSVCDKSPDFLQAQRAASSLKNLESLPKLIFVGRSAEHFVQLKSGKLKIWSQHSFRQGKSWIQCANVEENSDFSSSMYAPTLIDQTLEHAVGNSFWQFHLVNDKKQLGVWNRKSRLFGVGQGIESALKKLGVQVQVFQVTHEEFDVVLTKETVEAIEVLTIRYDSVASLK